MSYPAFKWLLTSDVDADGGVILDRAQDGSVRGRSLYPTTKRKFAGRHLLTKAECADLLSHYEANKTVSFEITWTGPHPGTYTVLYRACPKFRPQAPDVFDVEVLLDEE